MISVFFSYAHADEALRDRLDRHLSMLKRQGIIDVWHDWRLIQGEAIDAAIATELERADLILLLVSPDFLASDYCYERERRRALDRHSQARQGGADAVHLPAGCRGSLYDEHGIRLSRVLTDRGTEFCGRESHEYELYLAVEDIDHTRTKAKSPQTNGICERFHRTLLDEFYRIRSAKRSTRPLRSCRPISMLGSSIIMSDGHIKAGGEPDADLS